MDEEFEDVASLHIVMCSLGSSIALAKHPQTQMQRSSPTCAMKVSTVPVYLQLTKKHCSKRSWVCEALLRAPSSQGTGAGDLIGFGTRTNEESRDVAFPRGVL
jgi:hypothetical protein